MISHKHGAIFVHIPKCGGQSIEAMFLDDLGLKWEDRDCLSMRFNPNKSVGPPWIAHLTLRQYLDLHYVSEDILRDYWVFTIVRDPYRRVASLYKFLRYDAAISFRRFVLDELPRLNGKRKWLAMPQAAYVEGGEAWLDDVFRLEDLSPLAAELNRRFGFQEIPHVNRSEKSSFLVARLKHACRGVWGLRGAEGIAFPDDIRQAIREQYAADFERFGYNG